MIKRLLATLAAASIVATAACTQPPAATPSPAQTVGVTPQPTVAATSPAAAPTPSSSTGTPAAPAPTSAQSSALPSISTLPRATQESAEVILATTTSTQDSGLLDVLVPMFQEETGFQVKTIAVGTGQALALGARGEADVVLVHAPAAERDWMAEGNGTERLLVMYNDFVIIGPPDDPAQTAGVSQAAAAFQKIAEAQAIFISRGDESGTHQRERQIWEAAGVDPRGQQWYQETGQGMGATLNVANEKNGYTLTDRATYLARRDTLDLQILVQGPADLLNIYHVMPVNPDRFPRVNTVGGTAFAKFLVTQEAQEAIRSFGVDRFGEPLFVPSAGRSESELGG